MSPLRLQSHDVEQHLSDLFSKVGATGSGYQRYSAAMFFYNYGLCSKELLEIYRRCCKFDHEDPVVLAQHEGIEPIVKTQLENALSDTK